MQNYQNIKYNNTIFKNDKSDEILSLEYLRYLKNIDLNSANLEFVKIIRSLFKDKIDYFRGFIHDEIFDFLDLFLELDDSKKRVSTKEYINSIVLENEQLIKQNSYLHRYFEKNKEYIDKNHSFIDENESLKNENESLKNEIINLKKKLEKSEEDLKSCTDLNSNLNKELIEYYKKDLSESFPIDLNEPNSCNVENISEDKYIEKNYEKDYIDEDSIKDVIVGKSNEYKGLPENSWKNISNCIGIDFNEESCDYSKIYNKISFLLIKCNVSWNDIKNKRPIIPIDKKISNKNNKKYQTICYLDCFDHTNANIIKQKIEEEKVISTLKFNVYFSKPSWGYNKI